jgi:peptide-methionine (S)-S-oxide reductase
MTDTHPRLEARPRTEGRPRAASVLRIKTRAVAWLGLAMALASPAVALSEPMNADTPSPSRHELATFGGGCFWCLEAVFELVDGVKAVTSGYAGGRTESPTYKQVCSGETGHAEVVQIEYDPARVSYERLLEILWMCHDPTTLNRQGNDVGTQYRSVILYHNAAQKEAAEKSKAAAAAGFSRPIVTEIVPLTRFWPAEGYHQDYFRRNPDQAYCQAVIAPKVKKVKKELGK